MEGQAGVQPRPPAGCDGGQAGPAGGSFPEPQDRQTERAGAGLVMVLRAVGWAGRAQDVAWPPLGPHVPGGGHRGCSSAAPGSSAGDNVGCPEGVGRHPYSHGDSPRPALGVVNMAEHSSSKLPPKQPWEWQFAHSGGPQGQRCWGVPRPPQPAVLGLLLAQAGGRQVQGRASSTRTLLRINLFTKGKPNPFPTMN